MESAIGVVGTDITGSVALGNVQRGGTVGNGAANNTIGGLTTAAGVFHGFDFASATSPALLTLRGELTGPPQGQTSGGPTVIYRIDMEADGELLAIVNPQGFTARLMMLDSHGRVLVQSDAVSASDPDCVIDQYLAAGDYSLVVESTRGAGAYALTTTLAPATAPFQAVPVGTDPDAIVAGDFNGDGRTDLAVANSVDNTVSVLLGNGDGTFQPQVTYAVGSIPDAIVAGDFTGDGHIDLAVANSVDNTVSVLLGNGDGTFQPQVTYAVGSIPGAIVAGDFTGDGHTDLAVANSGDNTVSVLLGNGDGTFQPQVTYAVGSEPDAIVAGDFTGDGHTDLAVANSGDNTVSVLLGNGHGTFQPQVTYAVGSEPGAIVAGDFTGDGHIDLAVAYYFDKTVSVLLGKGDGTFSVPGKVASSAHSSPVVVNVNGDGTPDVLVLDSAGNILYRQGIPGQPGTFEPPVTVNPGAHSLDIAWVPDTDQGPVLASVDAGDNAISLYAYHDNGFVKVGSLATGRLPAQIIAANLNGGGLTDLVVRNAADGTLSVYFGTPFVRSSFVGPIDPQSVPPQFLPPVTIPVGQGVSDVQAVDTTGSGRLDLVVTNQLSGQLSILRNLGNGTFAPPEPYRAGTGLSAIDTSSGSPEVTSLEATAGVAAAPLTPGGPIDLVTANPGSNTLGVLAGLGSGLFANPVAIQTQHPAQVVRLADLTGNGIPDLVLLGPTGLSVMLGNGKGGFQAPVNYDVGPEPTGLTIADLNGNRIPDLLVSNAYGDLLVLLGKGDGTFQPYHKTDRAITLAVADLTGNGSKDIIYADQGLDRVVVQYGGGQTTVLGDQATGLLAPGAVKLADLTGDGIPDLIVANSGSNNVLIYPGLGNGQFGPVINGGHGYYVGTNPMGITVAKLTGPLPDLVVADKGSNQVTILLNQSQGGNISFRLGPRLNSGGIGPVSTVVGNFTGGVYPDILVSNSGSNNVALLPGVGQGFFNDQNPRTFAVGDNPGLVFVGNFDGRTDLVTVNAGSNDLTLISGFLGADAVTTPIYSGGTDPTAAFSFSAGSGFDDLVVGNGDGVLALFEGSDQGLTLTSSEINPGLPSPSALVYAGLAGGDVQFYAASAGREAAVLVALSLGGEIAPLSPPTPSPTPTVAQLVPLQESSLALVGTFLITTLPSSATEVNLGPAETDVATTVALSTAGPVALGQGVVGPSRGEETGTGGDEPSGQPEPAKPGAEPADASWQHRVLGTDEALERFDHEHPDLSRPDREAPPATNPSQGPGAIPAPAQENLPPRQGHPAADRLRQAVNRFLGHLHDEQPDAGRVGETHQEFNGSETHQESDRIKIRLMRSTHPAKSREASNEERCDFSAALALAASLAGEFCSRCADRRASFRSRRRNFPCGVGGIRQ